MIELFHSPNIDWIGKSKYFITVSLILLALGWGSIFMKGTITVIGRFVRGSGVAIVDRRGAPHAAPPGHDHLRAQGRALGPRAPHE